MLGAVLKARSTPSAWRAVSGSLQGRPYGVDRSHRQQREENQVPIANWWMSAWPSDGASTGMTMKTIIANDMTRAICRPL